MAKIAHEQNQMDHFAHMLCDAIGVAPQERMRRPHTEKEQRCSKPTPRPSSMERNRETGRAAVQSTDETQPSGPDMSSYWRGGVVEHVHHNGYAFIKCPTLNKNVFLPPPLLRQVGDLLAKGDKVKLRCFEGERGYVVSRLNINGQHFEVGS